MKISIYIEFISENAILMNSFVILPDVLSVLQPALNVIRNNLPIVQSQVFFAKVHSKTLRIMRLMSFSQ